MLSVKLANGDEAILQPLDELHVGDAEVPPLYAPNAEDAQVSAVCQRR